MDQLEDSETEEAPYKNGVMGMFPSDADSKRVFIKGGGKVHWVSYDSGQSFHTRRMGIFFCNDGSKHIYIYVSIYIYKYIHTEYRTTTAQVFARAPHGFIMFYWV